MIAALTAGLLVAAGVWLIVTGLTPAHHRLDRLVTHLHRTPIPTIPTAGSGNGRLVARVGRLVRRATGHRLDQDPTLARNLRLVQRPLDVYVCHLAVAALAGLLGPWILAAVWRVFGGPIAPLVPLWVGLAGAALGPFLVHLDLRTRARLVVVDLRHQLSAYLDVVSMLLAANHGNEGALTTAAEAGDGRLFVELRRCLYETAAAGRPVASGLEPLGIELGVPELVDVAATGALATTKGAPVSRALLAKTQSLRNTLSADTEQIARDRSVKLQIPLVLMGFITIATGIYPAVGAIHH